MAALRERNGKWQVQIRCRGRPPISATFSRKTDANEWARRVESDIDRGRHLPSFEARRKTLTDLVDRYTQKTLPLAELRSADDRERHLQWWADRLGDYLLVDITPDRIGEERDGLRAEGKSSGTTNRYLSSLSAAFSEAVNEWRWVAENPVSRVRKGKEPSGRVRFLSDEERGQLLNACRGSRSQYLLPVVTLALCTGARQGEILELRWSDVDFERKRVIFRHTKNGETRAVGLYGTALDELRELSRGPRRIDTTLVFPSRLGKEPVSIRTAWDAAVKEAQLTDFRFHDLRHTAASYLAMSGPTLTELAEILGHRTLAMVKRYSHLTEQHTSAVVARTNERFLADG